MVTDNTFKCAKNMLAKVGIELVFDDYELTSIDCEGEYPEYNADYSNHEEMDNVYKCLMTIYSERIGVIKEARDRYYQSYLGREAKTLELILKKEQEYGD